MASTDKKRFFLGEWMNTSVVSLAAFLTAGILAATPAAAEPRNGKLIYNVKINILSELVGGSANSKQIPICKISIFHFGTLGYSYTETASALAKLGSGVATCKITVPFRWANASPNALIESRLSILPGKDDIASLGAPFVRALNHRLQDLRVPAVGKSATISAEVDL